LSQRTRAEDEKWANLSGELLEYSLKRLGTTPEEVEMLEKVAENVEKHTESTRKAFEKVLEAEVKNNDNYESKEELRDEVQRNLEERTGVPYECDLCEENILKSGHRIKKTDEEEYPLKNHGVFDDKNEYLVKCLEEDNSYRIETITQKDRLFEEGQELE